MLNRILDLFRGPDPTERWRLSVPRPLTLDLASGAVNGIRPSAPYTELVDFGRPANPRPVAHGTFVYPEMGIVFNVAGDERVASADVRFQVRNVHGDVNAAGAYQEFRPARLRIVDAGGREVHVTPHTTPDEVRAHFGEPAGVDEITGEWLGLLYRHPGLEVEFEFGGDRALVSVLVSYQKGAA
jgi:hypothetical protein